jgi:tRNA(Ile)-lysidine synthase
MTQSATEEVRRALLASVGLARARLDIQPHVELRTLVAFSGGEDSRALLHALTLFRPQLNLALYVAHINHRLRAESDDEERFVSAVCKDYGLPLFTTSLTPKQRLETGNVEAWARAERYSFFERIVNQNALALIMTAHHQSDQAETILFRLLSGRLVTSGKAILPLDLERKILRPLLDVSKTTISKFVNENELTYVNDSSNRDVSFTRNRIRHRLLPQLERFNPRIKYALADFAQRLAADESLIRSQVLGALPEVTRDQRLLLRFPESLQWRLVIELGALTLGERVREVGYGAARRVVKLLARESSGTIELGRGLCCQITSAGQLSFRPLTTQELGLKTVPAPVDLTPKALPVPGELTRHFQDGEIDTIRARILMLDPAGPLAPEDFIRLYSADESGDKSIERAYFDLASLGELKLLVRGRRVGEKMKVFKRGSRSIKKLFQERGVKLTARDRVLIVEQDGIVIWIPGVARAAAAPLTSESREILELTYSRHP